MHTQGATNPPPAADKLQARRAALEAERDQLDQRARARREEQEKDDARRRQVRKGLRRLDLLARGPGNSVLRWAQGEGEDYFFGECEHSYSGCPTAAVSRSGDEWLWEVGLEEEGHAATKEEAMAAAEAAAEDGPFEKE
jgi:hypothetical protein